MTKVTLRLTIADRYLRRSPANVENRFYIPFCRVVGLTRLRLDARETLPSPASVIASEVNIEIHPRSTPFTPFRRGRPEALRATERSEMLVYRLPSIRIGRPRLSR